MEENCFIPPPINLNCWKHHLGFIKKQMESVRGINELEELNVYLLKIGESQMDLYFGHYSPLKISEQIINSLKQKKVFLPDRYKNWLTAKGTDYQLLTLSDKSVWTLRLGENAKRYIHIHPGRYSPCTVRVKAITLKTAIFILCCEKIGLIKSIETQTVNQIREVYLNEPPLKSFSSASGLRRLIDLFHETA